jgi:hypothetical protein
VLSATPALQPYLSFLRAFKRCMIVWEGKIPFSCRAEKLRPYKRTAEPKNSHRRRPSSQSRTLISSCRHSSAHFNWERAWTSTRPSALRRTWYIFYLGGHCPRRRARIATVLSPYVPTIARASRVLVRSYNVRKGGRIEGPSGRRREWTWAWLGG